MSQPDSSLPDLAALVQLVTEAVLRQLAEGASEAGGAQARHVGWLLGAPVGHLPALSREMAVLARLGHRQSVLGCADALVALTTLGLPPGVATADPAAPVSEQLRLAAEVDLLYVGALGWQQARELAAMQDTDPAVAVTLEALSRGVPVRAVVGDGLGGLHRYGPDTRMKGRLAAEAARIFRDLQGLGVELLPLSAIGRPLAALDTAQHSFGRSLGGLLTETDVERAAGEGRRELRLPAGTVVTPLARDRARELGVSIRRD